MLYLVRLHVERNCRILHKLKSFDVWILLKTFSLKVMGLFAYQLLKHTPLYWSICRTHSIFISCLSESAINRYKVYLVFYMAYIFGTARLAPVAVHGVTRQLFADLSTLQSISQG